MKRDGKATQIDPAHQQTTNRKPTIEDGFRQSEVDHIHLKFNCNTNRKYTMAIECE